VTFADAARLLAGQAGLLLGWRPEEFWRATPDELNDALAPLAAMGGTGAAMPDPATLTRLKEMHPDE